MSYFYGITDVDSYTKNTRKKNTEDNIMTNNDDEIEPVHGMRRRCKFSSHGRVRLRGKSSENPDIVNKDPRILSASMNKHKRHQHRENRIDDTRHTNNKIEEFQTIEILQEELKEKNVLLSKAKNKYGKLEKNVQDIREECEKLKSLLECKDSEYQELHAHHKDLTQLVKKLEQDKQNLSKITKKLNDENLQYKEDVFLLKILIYRLNVEIERYQDKIRSSENNEELNVTWSGVNETDPISEKEKIALSWGRVDLHALGPLLDAYQENLGEKETLIKQYAGEINHFSGRCKEIVAENENLRLEVEEMKSLNEKCQSEFVAVTENFTSIKNENDLLTKQIAMKKLQIQDMHNLYEKKVESMSQDNNKLLSDYMACTTELSNLRGKYEILNDGYEMLKNNTEKTMPVSVHASTVEECKRLFEELKIQYESEKRKLTDRVKQLEESNPQNERQLVIVTAERNQLRKQIKTFDKNYKRTQHKLDYLQRTVCSTQISRDSFKRQLTKMTLRCDELLAEQEKLIVERERLLSLLNEREKENENIQYLGNNIAHRIGNLKSQLQSVQKGAKEQLASVEKHIKIQEKGVGRLKTDYDRELERLKNLVKQKEDVIGQLQREKLATRDNLEFVWKAATSDTKKMKDALKNTKIYNI